MNCAVAMMMLLAHGCGSQSEGLRRSAAPPDAGLTIAFYNLENLFDPADDPANPGDDEFTPGSKNNWTVERLERKLEDIARVIRAMDEYGGADIVGVCEVEGRSVLDRLVNEFLPRGQYAVVHAESEDERGIDVALLYRRGSATFSGQKLHRIHLADDKTREVLEVAFERDGRRFTVLVNHWPSRAGGLEKSIPKRIEAAATAARVIDSLYALDPRADVILMGDLNDEPFDRSIVSTLNAHPYTGEPFSARMINLAAPVATIDTIGSYLYKGNWETIDQIMLSRGALDDKGIVLVDESQTIFTPEFIRDAKYDAKNRPGYRTYRGTLYIGGVSDHFPVVARVGWRK